MTSTNSSDQQVSENCNKKDLQVHKDEIPSQPDKGLANRPAPTTTSFFHQPKSVKAPILFIQKLYNLLDDTSIQHLISWSATANSFVMSPSDDFCNEVLVKHYKHNHITAFVRQLNMYGFYKKRDVLHPENQQSILWEFKHKQGNFKRGDIASLRKIGKLRSARVYKKSDYSKAAASENSTLAGPDPAKPADLEGSVKKLSFEDGESQQNHTTPTAGSSDLSDF